MKGTGLNSSSLISSDTQCHTQTGVFERAGLSGFMHMFSHLPFSQCGYLNSSVAKKKRSRKDLVIFVSLKDKMLVFYIILMS